MATIRVSLETSNALIREARKRDTTLQNVADELIGEVLDVSSDDESKVQEEDLPESESKE